MKGVYMFFADGFEETEAIAPADVLRRGGIDVKKVSINGSLGVSSSHGVHILTDMTFSEFRNQVVLEGTSAQDVMIFPGGLPGSDNLAACDELMDMMQKHYAEGGCVAAICAAPSVVLGKLPGLKGKRMTCYDGFEPALVAKGVEYTKEGVVTDGNIITGRGAGHAVNFGLAILAYLKGQDAADQVARSIML
ncbi:MAG: DJ-1/PfpI family protein [Bacteroidetes bacterium]|uniref:DJ-1/PfpI family protein n=1 Tax=Candidatus Cryptobacteroides faecavium TaxID=2840762 RepID=A0A9D9IFY0_9BACT|nr:DJ-1/PfpI family protein [Candidatus Cryptobacteroides faecavium]